MKKRGKKFFRLISIILSFIFLVTSSSMVLAERRPTGGLNHIDVYVNGSINIDTQINGVSQGTKTVTIVMSNVSATIVDSGTTKTYTNFSTRTQAGSKEMEFHKDVTTKFSTLAVITIKGTMKCSELGINTTFSKTFSGNDITDAVNECPVHSGCDFRITEDEVINTVTHNVTFKTERGGTINGEAADIKYTNIIDGEKFPDIPKESANDNYEFLGWYDESGNLVKSFPAIVEKDWVFIAKWKKLATPTPRPTKKPTAEPTPVVTPTAIATKTPTALPTSVPIFTFKPSWTERPIVLPTPNPEPTKAPTPIWTLSPSLTERPTVLPPTITPESTVMPTAKPTVEPSLTERPTVIPPTITPEPTGMPTTKPTVEPSLTKSPTVTPTLIPTVTENPTEIPNVTPVPIKIPTEEPTLTPTDTTIPEETPSSTSTVEPIITLEPDEIPASGSTMGPKQTVKPNNDKGDNKSQSKEKSKTKSKSQSKEKSKAQSKEGNTAKDYVPRTGQSNVFESSMWILIVSSIGVLLTLILNKKRRES